MDFTAYQEIEIIITRKMVQGSKSYDLEPPMGVKFCTLYENEGRINKAEVGEMMLYKCREIIHRWIRGDK